MDSATERELIEAAQDGDGAAFDALMRAHEQAVYRCAFAFSGSRETALDITQIVFLKMLTRLATFEGQSSLRTWLLRVATNELLNSARGDARRGSHVTEDEVANVLRYQGPDPESLLIRRTDSNRIFALIGRLSGRQRVAILLRHYGECTIDEIASALESTPAVAKNALYRAHRKLYDLWNESTPGTLRAHGDNDGRRIPGS